MNSEGKPQPVYFYYFSSPNSIPDSVCWSLKSDIKQLWVKGPFTSMSAAKKAIREENKERKMTAYERGHAAHYLKEQKLEDVKHFTEEIGDENKEDEV